MSVRTIYKCDKCGDEQNNNNQFWTVGVTANCGCHTSEEYVAGKSMQVCRTCLEGFGIHIQKKTGQAEQPKVPSVEELLAELIQRCS